MENLEENVQTVSEPFSFVLNSSRNGSSKNLYEIEDKEVKSRLDEQVKLIRYYGDRIITDVNIVLEAVRFENVTSTKRSKDLLRKGVYSLDEYINMKDEAKKNYFRSSLERYNKGNEFEGTYERIQQGIREEYIRPNELFTNR